MNTKQKKSTTIFIVLFLLSYIAINWNDVSWVFNYREVSGLVYDFFHPYKDSPMLVSMNNIVTVPGNSVLSVAPSPVIPDTAVANTQAPDDSAHYAYFDPNNLVSIPVIGVAAPMVMGQSTDQQVLEDNLDDGVVLYPGSVMPGQKGHILILGHSAPPNWPRIKHDYIFSDINNLNFGDEIILHFNGRIYTYKVINKKIITPGQEVDSSALSQTNNVLTLISCWPPGKNYKRITVTAELMT